ncbi:MAG: hypothetical protein H6R19_340 [Proteobacteria bacterium]|nr:hypothetical protein [Pseudomonadota bacterium]
MTPTQDDLHSEGGATVPRRKAWRSPLKREIALALLLKLVLLMGIKMMFFSHPVDKQEAAQRLGAMIDGGSAPATPASLQLTDKTEQK